MEASSDADILLTIGCMGRVDSPVFVQQVQQRRFHRCPHRRWRQLPHFPLRRFRHLHSRRPHGPRARKKRHRSRLRRFDDFILVFIFSDVLNFLNYFNFNVSLKSK